MRRKGKITTWNDDKGFGFITPQSGGKEIFVHVKSFSNRKRRPLENEIVSYKTKQDEKGKFQAKSVKFKWERVQSLISFVQLNLALIFTVSYLSILGAAGHFGKLPYAVLWFYLGISAVTFASYALDKSAAIKDKWRINENTLHLFSLGGGWPGALIAQRLIRHKSSKQSFQNVFWVIVFLNCSALVLWFAS